MFIKARKLTIGRSSKKLKIMNDLEDHYKNCCIGLFMLFIIMASVCIVNEKQIIKLNHELNKCQDETNISSVH
jgi:hypothetical protein